MQPISMMRWPSAGSRPVVSVSRTTSRIGPQDADDFFYATQGIAFSEPSLHDEVCPDALLGIGHLLSQHLRQTLLCHAGPREDAGALHEGRRAHHDGCVAP